MKIRNILFSIAFIVFPLISFAQDYPNPVGYVNDFANIISDNVEIELESDLKSYEQETHHEIAVATIKDLEGLDESQYAFELASKWKVGKEDFDNGTLILVAPNEKRARIEVGYGLEPAITDSAATFIVRDIMIPRFKEGNFDKGIIDGVGAVKEAARGELITPEPGLWENPFFALAIATLVIAVFDGLIILFFIDNRKRAWPAGISGIASGVIEVFFANAATGMGLGMIHSLIIVAVFMFAAYFFGKWLGKKGVDPNKFNTKSSGWGSGGGRSSGGSFGGFGGGSFGGGGGGGRW